MRTQSMCRPCCTSTGTNMSHRMLRTHCRRCKESSVLRYGIMCRAQQAKQICNVWMSVLNNYRHTNATSTAGESLPALQRHPPGRRRGIGRPRTTLYLRKYLLNELAALQGTPGNQFGINMPCPARKSGMSFSWSDLHARLRWTQPASVMRAPKRSRWRSRVRGAIVRRPMSVKLRPSRCSSVSAVSRATVASPRSPTPAARQNRPPQIRVLFAISFSIAYVLVGLVK